MSRENPLQSYYNTFDPCREHDIPMCADACPFRLDVLDLQAKVAAGRYNAAYKTLLHDTAFPAIVSRVCPAYCQGSCIRQVVDTPVQIRNLERSSVALATRRQPNSYNLPARDGRIAVIGAGLSGMGFAIRMASRKYAVTVYEEAPQIGGSLAEHLPEEVYLEEFRLQFQYEKYELHTDTKITDLQALAAEGYDVIYIATGKGGDTFGIPLPAAGTAGDGDRAIDMRLHAADDTTAGTEASAAAGDGIEGGCRMLGDTAVYLGGEVTGADLVHGLAQGLAVSLAAEEFLQTKKLRYPTAPAPSRAVANEDLLTALQGPDPDADGIYSDDDARAEASRCIRCQCDGCQSYCDIIGYFKKWPLKMRDEIYVSVKPAGSLVHKAPARGYINTCTQCGLFSEICPEGFDMCEMIRVARREMHKAGKNPAGYRQYWVRDTQFANGDFAALTRPAPQGLSGNLAEPAASGGPAVIASEPDDPTATSGPDVPAVATGLEGASTFGRPAGCCRYAFFPGCQLGALDPEYVLRPYRWLTEHVPDTGILLRCCNIPVDWDGDEKLHAEEMQKLRAEWESLGRPTLITACMSCQKHLREFLPEAKCISIYEIMAAHEAIDLPGSATITNTADRLDILDADGLLTFAVFDPCSARGNGPVQQSVRALAETAGVQTRELPKGDLHGCCGYGGNGSGATPDFRDYVAKRRADLSDLPYLVYCANCRDVFADNGKPAVHLFDLLFDIDPEGTRIRPGITQRRQNRVILKRRLLEEFWGETMQTTPEALTYELTFDGDAAAKAEKQRILAEDICYVIRKAEETGRRTRNPENNHYKAYREIGSITMWVEYSCPAGEDAPSRLIHNLYSHRMHIELEAVFNGKKVDLD